MFTSFVRWVLLCPVQIVICCFGIPCNIVSAFVWSWLKNKGQLKNKSVCNNFILLSIVDLCVLVFSILSDVLPAIYDNLLKTKEGSCLFGYFFKYLIHPAHFYFLFASTYLVTVLSVERLTFVMRPLTRLTFSKHWSRLLWLSIFVISFLVNIPSFFEYEILKWNRKRILLRNTDKLQQQYPVQKHRVHFTLYLWPSYTMADLSPLQYCVSR